MVTMIGIILTCMYLSCFLVVVSSQNGLGNVMSYEEYEGSSVSPFKKCFNSSPPVTVTDHQNYVSTYVINLNLAPEERWKEVAKDFKLQIQRLFMIIRRNTSQVFGIEGFHLINNIIPLLLKTLPKEYYEELIGISEAANLSVGEIVIFNVFFEFAARSTTILLEDDVGRIHQGKTGDFSFPLAMNANTRSQILEFLETLIVKIDYQFNASVLYSSIQFAGHIGILTGIKKDAFSLSVSERSESSDDTLDLVKWIIERKHQKWKSLVARKVMETANNFQQARVMLVEPKVIAPAYFILGGSKSGQGCVITRKLHDINTWSRDLFTNGSALWYLVQTNQNHCEKPIKLDSKVVSSIICLELLGRNDPVFTLYNVLATTPIINKYSVYAAILEPLTGDLRVWVQDCPDPC